MVSGRTPRQRKRFRGLFDQHPESLRGVLDADAARPAHEGRVGDRVTEIIGVGASREDARVDGGQFAFDAGRGCVDDEIERAVCRDFARQIFVGASDDRCEIREGLLQLGRARQATVGDRERRGVFAEQGREDAACRAACTEDQHARVAYRDSQKFEIGDEPRAVGVVAEQATVGLQRERVHRTGALRAVGESVGEARCRFFVRYGDVESAQSRSEECTHVRLEALGRNVVAIVDQILGRRGGEPRVDERRTAMRDRVTDDAVAIGRDTFGCVHGSGSRRLAHRSQSNAPANRRGRGPGRARRARPAANVACARRSATAD